MTVLLLIRHDHMTEAQREAFVMHWILMRTNAMWN